MWGTNLLGDQNLALAGGVASPRMVVGGGSVVKLSKKFFFKIFFLLSFKTE